MKYGVGDVVQWRDGDRLVEGEIYIADAGGAWELNEDSYDIITNGVLMKHVPQSLVVKGVKVMTPDQRERFEFQRMLKRVATYDDPSTRRPLNPLWGIDVSTEDGQYRFTTKSGSTYEISIQGIQRTVIRVNAEAQMRADEKALHVYDFYVMVGRPAIMHLEPLGTGLVTTRITTPVVKLWAV